MPNLIEDLDEFVEITDEEVGGDEGIDLSNFDTEEHSKDSDQKDEKKKVNIEDSPDLIEVEEIDNSEEEEETEEEEQEEEEGEQEKEESKEDESNDSENNEGAVFATFTEELREAEFFPDLIDEDFKDIGSMEDMGKLFSKQWNQTFNNWKEQYNQNLVQNLIDNKYITKEQAKNFTTDSHTVEDLENNEDVQKDAIREYYEIKGHPKSMIDRIIDNTVDLKETALEARGLTDAIKVERKTQLEANVKRDEEVAAKQRDDFNKVLRENIYKYEEFIPGRKLKEKDKLEVVNSIPKVLAKINSNLAVYAPILAYLDKYKMLDGEFDKLIAEGETKSTSKIGKLLTQRKRKTSDDNTKHKNSIGEIDDSDLTNLYG